MGWAFAIPPHRVDNVAWIIYPFESGVPVSEWVFKHCFPDRGATTQQRSCMLCFAVSKTGFWAVRLACERLKVRVDLTADGCRYTVLLTVLQRIESIKKMLDGAIDAPWEESPHIDSTLGALNRHEPFPLHNPLETGPQHDSSRLDPPSAIERRRGGQFKLCSHGKEKGLDMTTQELLELLP